jgi:hypothetical protein
VRTLTAIMIVTRILIPSEGRAGSSALLNYIFFVRTFDLARGNRLGARPSARRRVAGSYR